MADSGDRRSDGSIYLYGGNPPWRRRYMRLKSAGLCVRCGQTQVNGRAVCFDCVDRMVAARRKAVRREARRMIERGRL